MKKYKQEKPFIFRKEISEIKKENLFFSITYKETGSTEKYTDTLQWCEISEPPKNTIEVLKIDILKKGKKVSSLYGKGAKRMIKILDFYNRTGLNLEEIKPTPPPPEKDLIFCISLYFPISPKFKTSNNILHKIYLHEIVKERGFLSTVNNQTEKRIFEIYIKTLKRKRDISVTETNSTTIGQYLIHRNLNRLIFEIKQDFENGLLQVQEYTPPPTKRDLIKRANEYLKKIGSEKRIPLRKRSTRELLSDWKKKSQEINEEIKKLKQEPI